MKLLFEIDPIAARVLGVLIEKSLATPDAYPMSLNALTVAANQKVNREPLTSLSEQEVGKALKGLMEKQLADNELGGRVEKFRHRGTRKLNLVHAELAVLAELLLRGPQSSGELRSRASRMVPIDSLEQLSSLLDQMASRGFVRRLPPGPGSRVERYVQLLSPEAHPLDTPPTLGTLANASSATGLPANRVISSPANRVTSSLPNRATSSLANRIETLEHAIAQLHAELADVQRQNALRAAPAPIGTSALEEDAGQAQPKPRDT